MLNRLDEQGYVPLQWAALNNRTDVLNFLVGEGAQVNAVDHTGQTALHWAAVRGSLSAAETLLRSSADLRIRDCRGYGSGASQIISNFTCLTLTSVHYPRCLRGNAGSNVVGQARCNRQESLHLAS